MLYIFGGTGAVPGQPWTGLNELHAFDTARSSWARLSPTGAVPAVRAGHAAVLDAWAGQMLVCGGASGPGADLADAHAYNFEAGRWAPLASMPRGRWRHSAVIELRSRDMLVFGGATFGSGSPRALSELLAYNTVADAWHSLPDAPGVPWPRYAHRAVMDQANKRMIVYGGYPLNRKGMFGYEYEVNRWVRLSDADGTWPPAHAGGVFALFDQCNFIMAFGGRTADGEGSNDLYKFYKEIKFWGDFPALCTTTTAGPYHPLHY